MPSNACTYLNLVKAPEPEKSMTPSDGMKSKIKSPNFKIMNILRI